MSRDTSDRYDDYDDEYDFSVRKKSGDNTLFWVLIGGGTALLLLTCLVGVVIIAFVSLAGGPSTGGGQAGGTLPDQFVGSWKARWTVGGATFDSVYTFNKDGSFREQSFDLQGRPINVSDGRWHFRNGRIEINWHNGGVEQATANHVDARTMNYRIVNHTDQQQIGMTVTMRRQ